jgi:hypothetical protein
MVNDVEYGDNIGTLKNLFRDRQQAVMFAEKIIAWSNNEYLRIEPYHWYCQDKREYIKIEVE